ncbi:uncharacterized protein LOC143287397 [Babylonia areolata]|uniref:uncharacterized protein LOC143287397 n=1 Tax=Babylonia areolata TaxID=304850 RepID=UPI003FD63122
MIIPAHKGGEGGRGPSTTTAWRRSLRKLLIHMPRQIFWRKESIVKLITLGLLLVAVLGLLYLTGLLSYVPLLNRLVAQNAIVVTPLPPKVIHGHGKAPHRY